MNAQCVLTSSIFYNRLVVASVPEACLRGPYGTECSFSWYRNDYWRREESGVSVWSHHAAFSALLSNFLLSASELRTAQTGDEDFSISLLCLKNLKYSWLDLPRTFWWKCFTHDKRTEAPLFKPCHISILLSCDLWNTSVFLSWLSVCRKALLLKAASGLVNSCTVSSEHLKLNSESQRWSNVGLFPENGKKHLEYHNSQNCHELLACASTTYF